MAEAQKVVVGYWKMRGLVAPIKYLLEYLDVKYEEVHYEQGDAPSFSLESWENVKSTLSLSFPNLPYLLHGDVRLTESSAILRYIANQWRPELLGKTVSDKAIVDMVYSVVSDIRGAATTHLYVTGDKNAIKKIALERFEHVVKVLGDKEFIVGNYPTFVDFFIWEQIELFKWNDKDEFLVKYPTLAEYHKRISNLPLFAEYLKSERFMEKPFNNKSAKLNN